MAIPETPPTAQEMGLMAGFPPAQERIVTHANQLLAPYNRWSFQNELQLNPVADVWRGSEPVAKFAYDPQEIERLTYQNRLGNQFTFGQMVEMSYTDGIIVLQHGKVLYERYLNGMAPHSLHAWASGSKSMTGTLAALLAHAGRFDPDLSITHYLPELAGSGFAGASVRQAMDMTTAARLPGEGDSAATESTAYGTALGWLDMPEDYSGPRNAYEVLPTTVPEAHTHGERFTYRTTPTDVLAWLLKRVENKSLAEITREYIWGRLGAERDAFWIVGPGAVETAGSGLVTTLRDAARFAQLHVQRGNFNNQQILPEAVIDDIERGGDQAAFARGPAASPINQGWSYHQQWWHTHDAFGAYMGMGYGGQLVYIAPKIALAIVKFSSFPTPTSAGQEFYSAFAAFPALCAALA